MTIPDPDHDIITKSDLIYLHRWLGMLELTFVRNMMDDKDIETLQALTTVEQHIERIVEKMNP